MGKTQLIFILDDTGFDASQTNSQVLQNEEVTYVGLLVQEHQYLLLKNFMAAMSANLYKKFETQEFHFTDMYNRKGKFETLSQEEFLEIVDTLAYAVQLFDIDIFTQTVPKNLFETNDGLNKAMQQALQALQMKKTSKSKDFIFSIVQAKRFVEKTYRNACLQQVLCDEGVRKAGSTLGLMFQNTSEPIGIAFASSEKTPVLQMADFVAWMLTRSKQILSKQGQDVKEIDTAMLHSFEEMSPYYVNLPLVQISRQDWQGAFPYDAVVEENKLKK